MKKNSFYFFITLFFFILIFSCQKELSFERGSLAKGSLLSTITGDCLPKTVAGTYVAGKSLGDTNYIQVDVNVTSAGSYIITTDTVNGYSFKATGTFKDTGIVRVKLIGTGKPSLPNDDLFTVSFDASNCMIQISIQPSADTIGNAEFTLQGAPDTCVNASVFGGYAKNVILTGGNKVGIGINVTKPGYYTIATNTLNGYHFADTGIITATGLGDINLKATGMPLNTGINVFTVTAGGFSCTFSITVYDAVAVTNNDYFPLTTNSFWTYDDLYNTGDTIKRTINDSILTNGSLYKIMEEQHKFGSPLHFLYRKLDSNYYTFGSVDRYTTSVTYSPEIDKDILFLKEGLATGDIWVSDEYIGPASFGQTIFIRYEFTCDDANAVVTINGKTFANVYKITMRPQIRSATTYPYNITGEKRELYYAKGVGLIYTKFTVQNFTQLEMQIRNWLVK
jgi:hypothetical protein